MDRKKATPLEEAARMNGKLCVQKSGEDVCGEIFQTADELVQLLKKYGVGQRVDVTIHTDS